ncbi:hypothetical protein OG226_26125 [Streptomyces sp. NBC_01261]|nr:MULTISPECIES: hypothetical protein [unclassified Streptomyces]
MGPSEFGTRIQRPAKARVSVFVESLGLVAHRVHHTDFFLGVSILG